MLEIVGSCSQRVFGIEPAERLRRQLTKLNRHRLKRGDPVMGVAATATAILDEAAIAWLFEHPGELLGTPEGRPLAVALPEGRIGEARTLLEAGGRATPSGGRAFVRKLRRNVAMLALSLGDVPPRRLEWKLYVNAYKGVTDLVTKYVWPVPAFLVTQVCARLHIIPNAVTITGIICMVLATILWAQGNLVTGMLFAWLMTFLDTVDGKLARVTATSSKLGDLLDHVTDIIHPPIWWAALAYGLVGHASGAQLELLWASCIVILVGYVVGRVVETAFKNRFGYNCYLWRPFDSAFRLVLSRRNIILLIMTVGLLVGMPVEAYVAAAVWTLISGVIQVARLFQAFRAGRGGSLPSWLM